MSSNNRAFCTTHSQCVRIVTNPYFIETLLYATFSPAEHNRGLRGTPEGHRRLIPGDFRFLPPFLSKGVWKGRKDTCSQTDFRSAPFLCFTRRTNETTLDSRVENGSRPQPTRHHSDPKGTKI